MEGSWGSGHVHYLKRTESHLVEKYGWHRDIHNEAFYQARLLRVIPPKPTLVFWSKISPLVFYNKIDNVRQKKLVLLLHDAQTPGLEVFLNYAIACIHRKRGTGINLLQVVW